MRLSRTLQIICALPIVMLPLVGANRLMMIEPVVFRVSLLAGLVPLLLAICWWVKGGLVFRVGWLLASLVSMVALGLLTSIWAHDSYGAVFGTLRWLVVGLLAWLIFNLADNKEAIKLFLGAAAVGGGYMALVGVIQYLSGWEFYSTSTLEYPWPSATSGHKNQAAQFVVMTLPLAVGMTSIGKSRFSVWFYSLMTALMLAFLVYARARQAWVAVIVEGVFFLVLIRWGWLNISLKREKIGGSRLPFIVSGFFFLVLILMPPVQSSFSFSTTALNRMMERNVIYYEDDAGLNSVSLNRVKIWKVSLEMLPDFLKGAGFHNWAVHYPKYNAASEENYINRKKTYAGDAHNDYLQLVIELSPLVILIGIMLLVGLWRAGQKIYVKGDDETRLYFYLLCGGVVGLFVVMFFSFPLSRTLQPAYMGIYFGTIAALAKSSKASESRSFGIFKFFGCLLLAFVGVLGAGVGYKIATGNHHLWVAESLHQKIENEFSDKEKYPDVSPVRMQIAIGLAKSILNDPFNSRLSVDRFGLYTYLVLTEENLEHKAFYANLAKQQFQKAYQFMPYSGFLHNLNARMLKATGDVDGQEKALLQAVRYAPGDARFVKGLVVLYIEKARLEEAFVIADKFMQRFYEGEMVLLYTYLAQETAHLQRGLDTLSSIDVKLRNPHLTEDEVVSEEATVERYRKALATQVKQPNE